MEKIIVSDQNWFRGEQMIFPLYYDRELLYGRSLIKQANESEMSEAVNYIRNECKPEKGMTKFLVHAVAAGEAYGPNRNGDYFPWADLVKMYKTFEEHAMVYKHHKNKDKKKNFGTVEKAFLNHKMKRIELVIVMDNSKSPEILDRWEHGEDIAVSMACRLPFDVCSICKKKSPTIKQYCDHLKNQMNEILSSGQQVCAINPDPVFFDISFVWKPAERIAYVLMKAASLVHGLMNSGELALEEPERFPTEIKLAHDKQAILRKLSELEKQIESQLVLKSEDIKKDSKSVPIADIPDSVLKMLGALEPRKATKALSDRGIVLKFPEFLKMISKGGDCSELVDMSPGSIGRGEVSDKESNMYDVKSSDTVGTGISRVLDEFMGERSLFTLPATRRMIRISITSIGVPEFKDMNSKEKTASENSSYKKVLTAYNDYRLAACNYVALTKHASDSENFNKLGILSSYIK